jgi:hypothetical protein
MLENSNKERNRTGERGEIGPFCREPDDAARHPVDDLTAVRV